MAEVKILSDYKSPDVEKFETLYEQDRYVARVFAIEKCPILKQTVVNFESPAKFQIFYNEYTYGVSKTLKRYKSKKTTKKIFVNNGRFFIYNNESKNRRILLPLTLSALDNDGFGFIQQYYSWIRFLRENKFTALSFNAIVKNKLYSRDKVLRHMYKCKPSVALEIIKSGMSQMDWKSLLKVCDNADNLNFDLIKNLSSYGGHRYVLEDAAKLANKLNKKINLAWSAKRLEQEHDRWSIEFTNIVIKFDNEELNIPMIYRQFDEFIGGGLLITTSGRLAAEGLLQHHCVAGYKTDINSGRCAIYNISGFTCELKVSNKKLQIAQLRGKYNCDPSEAVLQFVRDRVSEFNSINKESIDRHEYEVMMNETINHVDQQLLIENNWPF